MRILSHRGYWKSESEKNQPAAFVRSFTLGFGTETDVRDAWGELYISHDPPTQGTHPLSFDAFCEIYTANGGREKNLLLALNIKADGLTTRLRDSLARHGITAYFCFDMSVPDTRPYLGQNEPVYTRHSEYEPVSPFYESSVGVWVDGFLGDWMTADTIRTHRSADKAVCLVSPDLHKRPHLPLWQSFKDAGFALGDGDDQFTLCTDYPEEAAAFFTDEATAAQENRL